MSKEYRTLKTEIHLPYELAYGATWTRFFEGMKERKYSRRNAASAAGCSCPRGASVPPASSTPTSGWKSNSKGTLMAWCYTNYRYFGMPTEPPFIGALIRLDGTDVNFLHLIGGFDISDFDNTVKMVKNGMKLKAVWSDDRKGHIMDIRYFSPV